MSANRPPLPERSEVLRRTTPAAQRTEIPLQSRSDAFVATAVAQDVAQRRGLPRSLRHRIALVTGELATNVWKHGGGGSIEICVSADRVEVRACDHGAGLRTATTSDLAVGLDCVVGPFTAGWGLEVVARTADVLRVGLDADGRSLVEATLFLAGDRR